MNTYIKDLELSPEGSIELQGWISGKRSSGKIIFLELRDGTGSVQCTVEAKVPAAFQLADSLGQESSVCIRGTVQANERQSNGIELAVEALEVIQLVHDYPISRKHHGNAFLMSHRHLWLRSDKQAAILRVRHRIIRAARDFFDTRGFTLIDTPVFQPSAAEGAGTLFEVDYFGDPAYLAQTGQLYLESAALALGKVYCFGPTFRAEKSKTRRHLTEFWMIEPEIAFAELPDLECLAEDFITALVASVLEHNRADLEILGRDTSALEKVSTPFPRVSYSEAAEMLRSDKLQAKLIQQLEADRARLVEMKKEAKNLQARVDQAQKAWKKEKAERELQVLSDAIQKLEKDLETRPQHIEDARNFQWGKDFGGDEETILSKEFDQPLIVTQYPREVKAFYMKRCPDDPRLVLNLDVLAPEGYGEIIGGSQREDDLETIQERMADENMDPGPYEWYLDLRRFGSVPHGGFGLGIERTVSWICGLKHIRETIPFPRMMGKLYP